MARDRLAARWMAAQLVLVVLLMFANWGTAQEEDEMDDDDDEEELPRMRIQKVIAVNAGGPSFVADDGIVYEADRYHNGGEISAFGTNYVISGTPDPELYQTERYHKAGRDLQYNLPMPQNIHGLFSLTLKFSEVFFNEPGKKVFSVYVNGVLVVKELDVFGKIGRNAAYDEVVDFEINNPKGQMYVNGRTVRFTETLRVAFRHLGKDNPKVNALLVQQVDSRLRRRMKQTKTPAKSALDKQLVGGILLCGLFVTPAVYSKINEALKPAPASTGKRRGKRS